MAFFQAFTLDSGRVRPLVSCFAQDLALRCGHGMMAWEQWPRSGVSPLQTEMLGRNGPKCLYFDVFPLVCQPQRACESGEELKDAESSSKCSSSLIF